MGGGYEKRIRKALWCQAWLEEVGVLVSLSFCLHRWLLRKGGDVLRGGGGQSCILCAEQERSYCQYHHGGDDLHDEGHDHEDDLRRSDDYRKSGDYRHCDDYCRSGNFFHDGIHRPIVNHRPGNEYSLSDQYRYLDHERRTIDGRGHASKDFRLSFDEKTFFRPIR